MLYGFISRYNSCKRQFCMGESRKPWKDHPRWHWFDVSSSQIHQFYRIFRWQKIPIQTINQFLYCIIFNLYLSTKFNHGKCQGFSIMMINQLTHVICHKITDGYPTNKWLKSHAITYCHEPFRHVHFIAWTYFLYSNSFMLC